MPVDKSKSPNKIKAVKEIWGVIKTDLLRITANSADGKTAGIKQSEQFLGDWINKLCLSTANDFQKSPYKKYNTCRPAIEEKVKEALNISIRTFDSNMDISTKTTNLEVTLKFVFTDATFVVFGYKTPVIKLDRNAIFELTSFLGLEINHTMMKIMFISIIAEIVASTVVATFALEKLEGKITGKSEESTEEDLEETVNEEDVNKESPEKTSGLSIETIQKSREAALETHAETLLEATLTSRPGDDIEDEYTVEDLEQIMRANFSEENVYTDEDAKQDIVDAVTDLCHIENYSNCKLHVKGIKTGTGRLQVTADLTYEDVEFEKGMKI